MSDLFQHAVTLHQQGRLEEAEKVYHQAIKSMAHSSIDQAPIYNNLGILLQTQERWSEALACYEQALKTSPDESQYHFNRGTIYQQLSDWTSAEQAFQTATELSPHQAKHWNSLGVVQEQHQHWEAAVTSYQNALVQDPLFAKALWNLARVWRQLEQRDAALVCYQTLIDTQPDWLEPYLAMAQVSESQEDWVAAIQTYRKAESVQPQNPNIWNRMGIAYRHALNLPESIACFQKVIDLAPEQPWGYLNLGNLHQDQRQYPEAIACYQKALKQFPAHALLHANLACALQAQGNYPEAQAAFDLALEQDPELASAHVNRGTLHLLLGHWQIGWQDYEWRLVQPGFNTLAASWPDWVGPDMPQGPLLVWAEQGYGDTIQFMRYLTPLQQRIKQIAVMVPEALKRLAQTIPGITEVYTELPEEVSFSAQVPIMSLPLRLGMSVPLPEPAQFNLPNTTIPARLPTNDKPRIGVVWASSPRHRPDLQASHQWRSCPLALWQGLFADASIQWVSLQTGPPAHELKQLQVNPSVLDMAPTLGDFWDTAQVLLQLDLIITVDTAVAHLAGSLGRTVWLLLPHVPDWRWALKTTTTVWYPTMTLFRQPQAEDWPSVMQRVQEQLAGWLQNDYNSSRGNRL